MHNISNTVSCISRRIITVFLLSSQQGKKTKQNQGFDIMEQNDIFLHRFQEYKAFL